MLRLFRASADANRDAVVREITGRVVAEVISQLGANAERMSPAELRGYVRASSRTLIRKGFQAAGLGETLSAKERSEQQARVSERIVHDVVRSFAAGPLLAIPEPHVAARKAA